MQDNTIRTLEVTKEAEKLVKQVVSSLIKEKDVLILLTKLTAGNVKNNSKGAKCAKKKEKLISQIVISIYLFL